MKLTHLIIALCLLVGLAPKTHAQRPTEYEVKAAYLFNFARFVTWPDTAFADAKSPIVIGVFGKDPFGSILEQTIQDKTAQERPLIVRRFQKVEDIEHCHILFIHPSEDRQRHRLLLHLSTSAVLTVGEQEGFAKSGGIINFIFAQRRIRFEINPHAAERAHLIISSRMLKVAQIVEEE